MSSSWYKFLGAHPSGIFSPMLEVLILTVLIYVILHFMHGTRGAGILRGLLMLYGGVIITILVIAKVAGLENIRWIMENIMGIAIIAVIVVFQSEIRRALIRIGESQVWNLFGEKKSSSLGAVVEAVVSMAKNNIGAIIVIERETRLGSYIEGGVKLDATVCKELLCTIFYPKTALHDGAVIIRKGRIVAANCLLPFTENITICRGKGARHRAGIGLSEQADAVVVIVSEETGDISVAIKGEIRQVLGLVELQQILSEHCAAEIEGSLIKESD